MKNKIFNYDFLIVGAGLIGSLTALALHQKKLKVLLIDKKINASKDQRTLAVNANSRDFLTQLGIWNYEKGHNLPAHFHNEFERSSFKTNEFVFVMKGSIECNLYTEDGSFIESVIVGANEGILMHEMSHEYKIIEDSIILESKNGPFMGVEKDKTVIDVKKPKN